MEAIENAIYRGKLKAKITVVIAPKDNPVVELAKVLALKVEILPYNTENYSDELIRTLKQHNVDIVCLAGYDRKIQPKVIEAFPERILNVHPSLLPKFGGQGMFGLKVHEAVLEAKETMTGCTIHIVDAEYDHGPIVIQNSIPVLEHDTVDTLDTRVVMTEHDTYWRAIAKVAKELDLIYGR